MTFTADDLKAIDTTPLATLVAREQNRLIEQWARTELPKFIPGIEVHFEPFDLEKIQDALLEANVSMHHIVSDAREASSSFQPYYCIMQGGRIVSRFSIRLAGSSWPEKPEPAVA